MNEFLRLAILNQVERSSILALLMLKIDRFELIRHSVGPDDIDSMVAQITERLRGAIRADDILLPQGDGGFAFILNLSDKTRHVENLCEAISAGMVAPFDLSRQTVYLTCCIGGALYPVDAEEAPALFRYADMALLRARDQGRNTCQFYSREMSARTLARLSLDSDLNGAVKDEQLMLHYQPLVDLQTGHISGFEALVRWNHPTLGVVPPDQFIPAAEESGLILIIGEWVLKQACSDMRRWRASGYQPAIAINMSARQFHDALLADKVADALSMDGIAASQLAIEMTETVLMKDTSGSETSLRKLKDLGVALVLDDFGTGYSSLSYLKRFPFNKVKIDRSFVQGLPAAVSDAALSKAIISMAHSLGIRVVAEGVEEEAQCRFLSDNLCDEIQGFYFSKAVSADAVLQMLEAQRTLPENLLRFQKPARTLLLVDDEANILSALKRLLRRDGYQVLTAESGKAGLEILAYTKVDVIISDQRMPGMGGVEFLSLARELYPDTIRMVLSGYTDLQSVTEAVNEGAIYKFLTKPWEDESLREQISRAFRQKEMGDENIRLSREVKTINQELAVLNRNQEDLLKQRQRQLVRSEISLDVIHEMLQHLPLPILGIDDDNLVVFANEAAKKLFSAAGALLGRHLHYLMPALFQAMGRTTQHVSHRVQLDGVEYQANFNAMGAESNSHGYLITLTRMEAPR